MRKFLFYAWCIGGITAYCIFIRFVMTDFGPKFGYGFFFGALMFGSMLFFYDRHVGRISGDPDHLRWWEAPAKDFIAAEKADYMQEPTQEQSAASNCLPPPDGSAA